MLLQHVIFSILIVLASCFQIQSKLYNLLHSVLPQDEAECVDLSEDCENRHGLCQNDAFRSIMQQKCPKTCGYCDPEETATQPAIEEESEQFTEETNPTSTELVVVETTTMEPNEPNPDQENAQQFSIKRLIGNSAERLTEAEDSEEVDEREDAQRPLRRYKKPCSDLADDCYTKIGLCSNKFYDRIMKRYCKRTCGFCGSDMTPFGTGSNKNRKTKGGKSRAVYSRVRGTGTSGGQCLDRGIDCRDKSQLCTNRHYKKLMKKMCPVTCNMCE